MNRATDRRNRIAAAVARVAGIAFVLLALFPSRLTTIKLALIGCGLACWVACLFLTWRRPALRNGLLAVVLVSVGFLLLPGRPFDHQALRQEYVSSMRSYLGTRYIWGGGNRLGIDCSGLIQRGLVDADVKQAVKTANPRLARAAVALWWHNRSADALGSGYRGETHLRAEIDSLNDAAPGTLQPGDIAVVEGGAHTLAYEGEHVWIQALPPGVYERTTPCDEFSFNTPARILRWTVFET